MRFYTLARTMTFPIATRPSTLHRRRLCSRTGCSEPVKKITAKYCSVQCCATDPQRLMKLRERSRSSARAVLPMSRQLTMPFGSLNNSEDMLAILCEGREDTPAGMSRLVV